MKLCLARSLRTFVLGALSLFALRTPAVEPPHPVLSIPGTGAGADSILTTYTEAQFLRFVPEWAPRGPNYNFASPVVPGDTGWSWNIASPDQITSTPSGTVFPHASYQILYQPLEVLSGKIAQIPYYLAAGSSTRKSMLFGVISFQKRAQLRRFFNTLAPAYVLSGSSPETRNDAYARRIAIALDAWANYVPDYDMVRTNSPTFVSASDFTLGNTLASQVQRASDHNGLAHEWNESELLAFDAIYDSQALVDLSLERGYNVREHIKQNLFFNIGDFFRDRVPISAAIATNLSSPFSILAKTARVLNRPDYIIWMGDYLDATIRQKINRDGVLLEGIGYSYNYLAENIDAATSTRDYFLTRSAGTAELDDIFTATNSDVPILQKGISVWNAARLPDGTHSSFGDTNFDSVTGRQTGNTVLLPAYGHLAFGTGSGAKAVQLNQNFSDDSNHMRSDVSAYTLWAKGAELLGNVRYYNSLPGRNFTEQILAYNAVTIDRANMSRGGWTVGNNNHRFTSGNLTLFEPMNNGLSVSEVDGQRAYANRASRYQRLMILNTVDPDRPYAIDVFRVTGGTTHDYTLHGAIRFDQTGESNIALTPMAGDYPLLEGETWVEPTSSGSTFPYYGYFRNVKQGTTPENFRITYRDTSASKRDLRLWLTGESGSTAYLGVTPNPSRDNSTPANFYTYWRPSTIVRHRNSSGSLQSLYANVIEPMSGGVSSILAVARLPLAGGGQEAVALRVWFTDGRFDTYLVNLRNPKIAGATGGSDTIATADGEYSLTGRVGAYVSRPAGESRVWTLGASSFKFGPRSTTNSTHAYEGNVTGATRQMNGAANDAIVVDASLPLGTALRGRQLSLTFGDYQVVGSSTIQSGIGEMFQIDRIEQIEGQTHVILTADHQLMISGNTTTELVSPERTFTGGNTFQIVLSSSSTTESSLTPTPPDDTAEPPPPPPPPPPPTYTPAKMTIPSSSVTASTSHSSYPAANTVDGSLSTRWAGNGEGVTISYDLGAFKTVDHVKIAWFQGNTRTYTFDLQASLDGSTWTTLLAGVKNTASTSLQTYHFSDTYARYVRLVGHRNTVDGYMNITEFEIWADDRAPASAPAANPASGTYHEPRLITLGAAPTSTSIRYTLDGTTPTRTHGELYTEPFQVSFGTTTLKAIAYGETTLDSAITTEVYQIIDNTPPVLSHLSDTVKNATSAAGAEVSFPATAADDKDGTVPVTFSPVSGSLFPIGSTTVTASATDTTGNTATKNFTVTITPIVITRGGYTLNRRTNTVTQRVTLTNVSAEPIAGPIYLVLDGLSPNTTLTNPSGVSGGVPYITVSAATLTAGASASVTLQFTNPESGGIIYNPRTVSGATP